jgi:hypothetical protein
MGLIRICFDSLRTRIHLTSGKSLCAFVFLFLLSCIDPLQFDINYSTSVLVVEGMISDQAGPYTLKLSTSAGVDTDQVPLPFSAARVTLFAENEAVEDLKEETAGSYTTSGSLRGEVGKVYHVRIQTPDGKIFESKPEQIQPAGFIKTISYEFEPRTVSLPYGDFKADVFNVFIDGFASPEETEFLRWRFTGMYKVVSNPELHKIWIQDPYWLIDPLPCSGFVVGPYNVLIQREACTCCTCWSRQYETLPQLSDQSQISEGNFNKVKVAEVPITTATFFEKYLITVEQMSLSDDAFQFFKIIRNQKLSQSDLFQAAPGEIVGNIKGVNNTDRVVGLFYATSIDLKRLVINRSEVPYNLPPQDLVTDACTTYYPNSTTIKPVEWE